MAESLIFKIEAINRDFNKAMDEAAKKTENLEKNLLKTAKVSSAAFVGFAGAIGGVVKQAAKIETIKTQFEVLTGSVQGANAAVQQLQDFSSATPFAFEEVANAGKQLLAFGFEVSEIENKLESLGNVAAASGKGVGELSTIFGQVSAAGKLTGERLLQFQERSIPIGPALAKTLGVAESAVKDLVSKGAVDFATFEKAFDSLSQKGGFAFGGLEKASQTLDGQISTLKDNFALIAGEVGQAFLPTIKEVTTATTEFLQELRDNEPLKENIVLFLKWGAIISGTVAALATAGLVMVKVKVALAALGVVIGSVGGFFIALGTAVSSVASPFIALGAVVSAFVLGYDSNLSFAENFTQNFAKRIATIMSGLGKVIGGALNFDTQAIKDGFAEVKTAFAANVKEMEKEKDALAQRRAERDQADVDAEIEKQGKLLEAEKEGIASRAEIKNQEALANAERQLEEAEAKRALNEEIFLLEQEQGITFNDLEREQLREHLSSLKSLRVEDAKKELADRRKQRAEDLKIEKKFGADFLAFNKLIRSQNFQNAQKLAQQNINLQQSSNNTLKTIGKAAAITDIVTKSAQGAQAVFTQAVSTFPPPFGPIIGGALAAAQIAYGAERVSQVRGAQDGALVEGIGGGDRQPFMLERGELVVPRRNFDDVVSDAATRRNAEEGEETGGGSMEVTIGFTDDAFEIIEEKILERRATGVGVL